MTERHSPAGPDVGDEPPSPFPKWKSSTWTGMAAKRFMDIGSFDGSSTEQEILEDDEQSHKSTFSEKMILRMLYFEIFSYPLTLKEIVRYLSISPAQVDQLKQVCKEPDG